MSKYGGHMLCLKMMAIGSDKYGDYVQRNIVDIFFMSCNILILWTSVR
jgi:hypothetical protein